MLPQVNATLTSVSRGGFTEDYDRPAGGGLPTLWSGSVDSYFQNKIRSGFDQSGGLQRAEDVTLIIDNNVPVKIKVGDRLTYRLVSSGSVRTGVVQNITSPAEIPTLSDYYKCYLEEIAAL